MTREELKQFYIDKGCPEGKDLRKKEMREFITSVKELGSFIDVLDGEKRIGIYIKMLMDDITCIDEVPKCNYCHTNPCRIHKNEFTPYCSNVCKGHGSKSARESTMKERYGVTHALQSSELKSKAEATMEHRYGVSHPSKSSELMEKKKKNNLEKYGETTNLKTEETKEKIRKTNLERYGAVNPMLNERVIEKAKETNRQRYGVDYKAMQSVSDESYAILNSKEKLEELYSFDAYDNTQSYEYPGYDPIEEDVVKSGRGDWKRMKEEETRLRMLQEDNELAKMFTNIMKSFNDITTVPEAEGVFVDIINLHRYMDDKWNGEVTFSNTVLGQWNAIKNKFKELSSKLSDDIVNAFKVVMDKNPDVHERAEEMHADHEEKYLEFAKSVGSMFGNHLSVQVAARLCKNIKDDDVFKHFLKGIRSGFKYASIPEIETENLKDFIFTVGEYIGYKTEGEMTDLMDKESSYDSFSSDETAELPAAGAALSTTNTAPVDSIKDKFLDATGLSTPGYDDEPFLIDHLKAGIIHGIKERINKNRSSDATGSYKAT